MSKETKIGSLSIILSALFFGTYGIWSKLMAGIFDDFFQSWTRSLIILVILIPIGIIGKNFKKINKKDLKWYLIYSIPGALVVPTMFYAFTKLSVGTTTLLFYSALTISTYIYGIFFFKEKMNTVKIISLLLGIIGLLAIYTINFEENLLAMVIATIAGIGGGTEVTFTKKLSDKYSSIQLTTFLYSICFIMTFIGFLIVHHFSFDVTGTTTAWMANIGHSLASLAAFLLVVRGYKHLEPSIGGIIGLLEIPVGVILAIIIFNEPITISIIIGGLLIITACLLPNVSEIIKVKKKSYNIK